MKSKVRYITYTAMFLALAVLFQSLRTFVPILEATAIFGPFSLASLIVGSLVNLCLILAAVRVGFWSGAAVSVLSTIVAFMQGHLPAALPQMIAVVSVGNTVIVAVAWSLRKVGYPIAFYLGAVAKSLALWGMVTLIVVPFFSSNEAMTALLSRLAVMFSWPQIVTGVIGASLALAIAPALAKSSKE